jgi:formate dehydrogenase maturation protein FdhE
MEFLSKSDSCITIDLANPYRYKIIEKTYLEAKGLITEAIKVMESIGEKDLSDIAKSMIEREF